MKKIDLKSTFVSDITLSNKPKSPKISLQQKFTYNVKYTSSNLCRADLTCLITSPDNDEFKISFTYVGIFEFDPDKYEISDNKDIFDTVSEVFGKPLSPTELQKITELLEVYGEKKFIEALRLAEAKRTYKIAYIEGILRNEK